ncbi:zinc finger CCCH domain-containing protein 14 isoform X2 [Pieris brassicae]|uniref:zinc finger CCCH domain-containing protein 14 isoform X2 n=1 Tax=Pieris brassicae TaxID=7116 RepID=UPI001E65FB07|nr:zinc finger CCCH domain-containing protein 14 isoform X2 [Pieris brassicae]
MDVVGSEIGQKMRSAIKAKLTELGCYVDDELPDYVMVMVANKRTQMQMEDDLQLFLADNTELFVNWLHQVLKKLQEVTVAAPLKIDKEKAKERSASKDRKSKEKKDKDKSKRSDFLKKSKKKEKEKLLHKKEKKLQKSKKEKRSKSHERIRPNIPPLLMNMEKHSEPSITDVFAGQILKNHGVNLDNYKDDITIMETKAFIKDKRQILPIIDPASILETDTNSTEPQNSDSNSNEVPRQSALKEMNEIEAKIQGLKQKLVEQLDSMSDDEDFLNIRTEAEELMNDFAEDVFQEISQPTKAALVVSEDALIQKNTQKSIPKEGTDRPVEIPKLSTERSKDGSAVEVPRMPDDPTETLPQIELNLPKRPIRERLGTRNPVKDAEVKATGKPLSPESFTPERETTEPVETRKADDRSAKRLTSKVCASVVRVRPRPRADASASNLLLRAVADAHKSLLNVSPVGRDPSAERRERLNSVRPLQIPPKVETEPSSVKRALVLPMRRCVDPDKIVIRVAADGRTDEAQFVSSTRAKDEYPPIASSERISNSAYVPTRSAVASASASASAADSLVVETINIHNPTVDKDKDTQFIVTMDGYHPNAFLAKKLLTEGLLDDDDGESGKLTPQATKEKEINKKDKNGPAKAEEEMAPVDDKVNEKKPEVEKEPKERGGPVSSAVSQKKRLSDTSEDSGTQVIIKREDEKVEKRKRGVAPSAVTTDVPAVKKRRASPIVFDVDKKAGDRDARRERTVSASSDSHSVSLTTLTDANKYDAVPPLSQAVAGSERRGLWCRAFPSCRFGPSCAFVHPRCKFAASCTRRGCVYAHDAPSVASHVVPVANFKSVPSSIPNLCKFYPNCANPSCHFYHPKPCRFGKACANRLECNFYHADVPGKMYTL